MVIYDDEFCFALFFRTATLTSGKEKAKEYVVVALTTYLGSRDLSCQ